MKNVQGRGETAEAQTAAETTGGRKCKAVDSVRGQVGGEEWKVILEVATDRTRTSKHEGLAEKLGRYFTAEGTHCQEPVSPAWWELIKKEKRKKTLRCKTPLVTGNIYSCFSNVLSCS